MSYRLPTVSLRRTILTFLLGCALAGVSAGTAPEARGDVGFADGSFSGTSAPSGMKPQSKLWVADGIWWGVMFDNLTQRFEIYRRNAATEQWSSTGTVVDGRRNIWADAKWNGTHLYVVTHGASWTSTLDGIHIGRYSYDTASKSWSVDSGFPLLDVGTTPGHTAPTGTEAAVIDQDSAGRIWLTWTRDGKTWVTHSTTDTRTFVTPFVVPVPNADNLTTDDISTLVAYDGRIGVLWSNESVWCMCFAIHNDGDPDGTWTSKPMVGPSTNPADKNQELADDHMNLKAPNDGSGYVYAASKTSLDGMNDPLLWFNVFDGSNWTHYTYATVANQTTRAQIALDLQHQQVYMFSSSPCCNGGVEYYKQSSLRPGRIGFPAGLGTPFISSATNAHVNNISTTKQTVDTTTNLVAIAGDDTTKTYVHNTIDLSKADTTPPDTSLLSGPTGTVNNPDARFTFSATEPDSTFECSFDGAAFAACSSPKTYLSVGDGGHTFRVRAVDAAGNADGTPATRTWTVENTATVYPITAEADTYVRSSSPTSNFGSATTLNTDKGSGTDPDKWSYYRFSVTGTRKIVSAKVRTWVTGESGTEPQIFSTSPTWGEATTWWNNRPAAIGGALDGNGGPVAAGAYHDYDVSAAVTGNGTYSFVTKTTSTDALDVASRENTAVNRPPLLELLIDPPPDTSVDSGPPPLANSASASFAFSSNDAGSTFACKLDAAAYVPCSSPKAYSGLANGSHTLSVRATDVGGLTDPSPATHTWTVDTAAPAPPTVALTPDSDSGASSTDRITNDTSPTFTGTAEPGTVVTLSADALRLGSAVVNAAGDWTLASEDLPAAAYTITATVEDGAGNNSGPSSGLSLTIDTTPPPDPSITSPASDLVTPNPDVTVSGTADPGLAVEVLDGTSTAATLTAGGSGAWTTDLTGLADGAHPISAVTRDVAGNPSQPARRTVTVDTVVPDTTITSGPPDPTTQTTATFEFTSSEAGATFECKLDNGGFTPCSSPASYEVGNGSHSLAVRAIDAAGNVDGTPASRAWTVNGSLPARPAITAPDDGSFSASQHVTVSGTADPGVTIEVFEGSESKGTTTSDAQGDWSVDVTGLAEGLHRFTAFATNGTGTNGPSDPVDVTVDTTAPATTIDSGPADPSNAATATFGFSSDESGATYECRRDGAAFAACTSPATVSGLGDGSHSFDVRAVDRAGNTDPTPASRTWTVDTAAPDTTITSGPPNGTVAGTQATFAFVSTETGGTFQCRLDGGAYAACASPHTVSNLAPGTHVFTVRATDAAGNTDPTPATRTWQAQQTVFSDGFETGGFVTAWTRPFTGADGTANVVTDVVRTGTYAARLSATANTGSFSMLRHTLSAPHADVTVDQDIRIEAEGPSGGNVPILRLFDALGTRQLTFYRQNANADRLYVNGTATLAAGRLPLGTWGHFTVHVITGPAGAGTIAVSLNGTQIYNTTTATLGTAGVATIQLGNDTKKQPFQVVADNVMVTLE